MKRALNAGLTPDAKTYTAPITHMKYLIFTKNENLEHLCIKFKKHKPFENRFGIT